MVVTGGEDDRAFVWDLSTGEAIFKYIKRKKIGFVSADYTREREKKKTTYQQVRRLQGLRCPGRVQPRRRLRGRGRYVRSPAGVEGGLQGVGLGVRGQRRHGEPVGNSSFSVRKLDASSSCRFLFCCCPIPFFSSQWLSWHDGTNVLFATTVDSELWMWKIPSGDSKIFAGHGERAETAKVRRGGKGTFISKSE